MTILKLQLKGCKLNQHLMINDVSKLKCANARQSLESL